MLDRAMANIHIEGAKRLWVSKGAWEETVQLVENQVYNHVKKAKWKEETEKLSTWSNVPKQ